MKTKQQKKGYVSSKAKYQNNNEAPYAPKLLDIDNFDVQILRPEFLQAKTLKKPFKELDIHLKKTNLNGIQFQQPIKKQSNRSSVSQSRINIRSIKYAQNIIDNDKHNSQSQYQFISCSGLNIKPAHIAKQKQFQFFQKSQIQLKDKNSIISALFRKGQSFLETPIQIKVSKAQRTQNNIGEAQAKLKRMFNKQKVTNDISTRKMRPQEKQNQQIDEQIHQSINQEYQKQSFEKLSGAYQSQIRQSIRQSIMGGSSGMIKQSIHDYSMPESIKQVSSSKIKQDINEQIGESLPKQNIQQQVYEQIFQQASLSDQVSKSKSNRYIKKPKQEDKFQLSVSASKGFRTKTANVMKSIKFAQQLETQNQAKNAGFKIQQKIIEGDKIATQVIKQNNYLQQLKIRVSNLLSNPSKSSNPSTENRNLQLCHKFKIEVNRLITSENFMSKLRKITAFIDITNNKNGVNNLVELQDRLVKNLYDKIYNLKFTGVTQNQLSNVKKQYDERLQFLLKQQQMSLKVQMQKKLHEKDLQLKKMIAELEQKFRVSGPISYIGGQNLIKQSKNDKFQIESDYSIDSDDVTWKMDLWQMLPDYEKKKMYQKQGTQVAKFLTDYLMKQIRQQSLDRSLSQVSFQFPQDFNQAKQIPSPNFDNRKDQKSSKKLKQSDNKNINNTIKQQAQNKKKTNNSQYDFPPLPNIKSKQHSHPTYVTNIQFLQSHPKIHQNSVRQTLCSADVIKILAKYKSLFSKKKNDSIRKIVKTFQTKSSQNQPLISVINQVRILNKDQLKNLENDAPYVKAYEQNLIMELMSIFNKNKNRKNLAIQEQMKKMYDRLVVTCQVKTAEASVGQPTQIIPEQNYIQLLMSKQDKKIKDILVTQICSILTTEFAKQFPKRK